ncbi:MAG: exo-alpha-sialidase [Bacteroidetes bacterium]|nr:exo-alpha-sialidase [Bacteroidota bacterium]
MKNKFTIIVLYTLFVQCKKKENYEKSEYLFSPYTIVSDTLYHSSEGCLLRLNGDTLLNIFRLDSSNHHVSNGGQLVERYSFNVGKSWTQPSVIYDSKYDDRNVIACNIDNSGRIIMVFRRYDATAGQIDIGYCLSEDQGKTWGKYYILLDVIDDGQPFGNILKCNDGRLKFLISHPGKAQLYESGDLGLSWKSKGLVYDFSDILPDEAFMEKLNDNNLIMICRDEATQNNASYFQFVSINNGNSWNYCGRTNLNQTKFDVNRTAPFLFYDNSSNIIYAVSYERNINTNKKDSIFLYKANPAEILNSAKNWKLLCKNPRPMPISDASFYGYPRIIKTSSNSFYGVITDRRNTTQLITDNEYAFLYSFNIQIK